jgi:hypothetical protein
VNGKNEKHGDNGRSLEQAEKQIKELEASKQGKPKKERDLIDRKIDHIKKNAAKNRKGVEHSIGNKR